MCVITVDGKKYWEWDNGELVADPNLTNGQVVATTGPGHCDKTGCESGNFIPTH
jgi:hypothetical protein